MFVSPFLKLTIKQQQKLTYLLLFSVVLCIIILKYFDSYLINDVCKNGIISFELVKTVACAQAFLDSWNQTAKIVAGLSLGFDFLFPIVYASFLALLVHILNVKIWTNKPFFKFGNVLIWTLYLAAIFDFIENFSLIQILLGNVTSFYTNAAYYFASVKFLLLLVSILYIFANFILFLIKKYK